MSFRFSLRDRVCVPAFAAPVSTAARVRLEKQLSSAFQGRLSSIVKAEFGAAARPKRCRGDFALLTSLSLAQRSIGDRLQPCPLLPILRERRLPALRRGSGKNPSRRWS